MTREKLIVYLNIKAIGIGIPYLADKVKWKNGNTDLICYCSNCYNHTNQKKYVCASITKDDEVVLSDNYCSNCGKKIDWNKTKEYYKEVEGLEDGC